MTVPLPLPIRHDDLECYTVTVTRVAEGDTLLSTYDADSDGQIDLTEVSAAIDAFFDGDIDLATVSARHRPLFRIKYH